MFEEALRAMKQLNGSAYRMKINPDKNGYLDKECPNQECSSKFKVWPEDWGKKNETDIMFCPFCGHQAPFKSWYTTEQIEQVKMQAYNHIKAAFGRALQKDADNFNKKSHKGFITMSMKFSGPTYAFNLPAEALEEMEQQITCEKCGSRYSVVGSAFYCPFCGYNSAQQTFTNTILKVKDKIYMVNRIYKLVPEISKDTAARTCESLIETSLSDLVMAFQRLCECIYPQLQGAIPLTRNIFQRLDDGNNLWKNLINKGYEDWSSLSEYTILKKCFQQRHLLQHKDGIVDQDYIEKSGDVKYSIGQHMIISKENILQYLDIVEKIGNHILKLP